LSIEGNWFMQQRAIHTLQSLFILYLEVERLQASRLK